MKRGTILYSIQLINKSNMYFTKLEMCKLLVYQTKGNVAQSVQWHNSVQLINKSNMYFTKAVLHLKIDLVSYPSHGERVR